MSFLNNMASQIDIEKTKRSIALVLDKLKTDVDLDVLKEYREVFKKEVSFFTRSWAAAYLLMYFDHEGNQAAMRRRPADASDTQSGAGFRGYKDRPAKNRRTQPEYRPVGARQDSVSGRTPDKNGDSARQYPLADEDSKCIFISIGRNRRVFPREILGLIIARTGVSRDDIGTIRILENYSFVQVRDTITERIIESLNGYVFRGRTLTVNFAKTRKEGAENSESYDDNGDESAEPEDSAGREIPPVIPDAVLEKGDPPAVRDDGVSEQEQD
jgi:hypothetical protein